MKFLPALLALSALITSCSEGPNQRYSSNGSAAKGQTQSQKSSNSETNESSSTDSQTDSQLDPQSDSGTTDGAGTADDEIPKLKPADDAVAYYYIKDSDTGICYDYRFDKAAAEDSEKIGSKVMQGNCPTSVSMDGAEVKQVQACPYIRLDDRGLLISAILFAKGTKEGEPYSRSSSDARSSCARWELLGEI